MSEWIHTLYLSTQQNATPQYREINSRYTSRHGQMPEPLCWAKGDSKEFIPYDYAHMKPQKQQT